MSQLGQAITDHRYKHEITLSKFSELTGGVISCSRLKDIELDMVKEPVTDEEAEAIGIALWGANVVNLSRPEVGYTHRTLRMRDRDHIQADPVILLQKRVWGIVPGVNIPDGWMVDDEGDIVEAETDEDGEEYPIEDGRVMTLDEAISHEVACEQWETVSVWYDRDEARDFAEKTAYNFKEGWRTWAVSAKGELVKILKVEDVRRGLR